MHLLAALITALVSVFQLAAAADVAVTLNSRDHQPRRFQYLNNSETILMWELGFGKSNLVRSEDSGKSWSTVSDVGSEIFSVAVHPADPKQVFVLTPSKIHYRTTDTGKTWQKFETELQPDDELGFNMANPAYILFHGRRCEKDAWSGLQVCHRETYYTTDGFSSSAKLLLTYTMDCQWAKSSLKFHSDSDKSIFCNQWPDHIRSLPETQRDPGDMIFLQSSTFFTTDSSTHANIIMLNGGAVNFGFTERFLIVAVKIKGANEIAMYVSVDGVEFTKSQFPNIGGYSQQGYTIIDSTENSVVVDVLADKTSSSKDPPFGLTYFSNSNATYFRQALSYTNRLVDGRVDFERISSPLFEGIIFVNQVSNPDQVPDISFPERNKKLVSKFSMDNGVTWKLLRPPKTRANGDSWICQVADTLTKDCSLHFHSVTNMHNVGRTFSSNSAPGFAIGIGSVGPYLKDYANSNTFFSDDGGQFWKEVKSGPHLFEILDSGSILVLVKSGSPTNEVSYSLDRGATWKSQEIKIGGGEGKWMATFSDTDDDAVTSKMIIFAAPESDSGNHPYNIIHLDFSGLRSRKCETPDSEQASQLKDFEIWRPGSPSEVGEPCMLGLKQGFYRKKADVDCFVGGLLAKKTITPLACECVKQDYECGYNYVPKDPTSSSLECILSSEKSTKNQPYDCKTGDKFVAHPYSKIPGDGCKQKKDDEWAKGIETDCQARSKPPGQVVVDPPEGRDPKVKMTEMNGLVTDLRYFPGSSVAIAISALSDSIYRTDNEGQTWTELIFFKDKGKIVQILFHPTSLSRAFILVQSSTESNIWYTNDRFASVPMRFVTPKPFNNLGVPVLSFHIEKEDWILFIGMDDGHTSLFASYDNGSGWSNEEEQWVEKCEFGRTLGLTKVEEKSVYCQKHKYTGSKSQPRRGQVAGAFSLQKIVPGILYNDKRELFPDGILDFYGLGGDLFAIMSQSNQVLIQVASDEKGISFEKALFPPNIFFKMDGITLLKSNGTGKLFVDISQSDLKDREYGSLFSTSYDGVQYSRILHATNINAKGVVDFDRVEGLPGIIFANQVNNPDALGSGARKNVSSVISFDNGASWTSLKAPEKDSNNNNPCDGVQGFCSLHLHGPVTHDENSNGGHSTPINSNSNAIGLVIGVGNVGNSLSDYNSGNVYISRDAGKTWTEARKEAHRWAIGDHGGIIAMVNDEAATDTIIYSWDFGFHWAKYKFSSKPVRVNRLMTETTGTGSKFIITGVRTDSSSAISSSASTTTIVSQIDFSQLIARKCELKDDSKSDFETWNLGCFMGQDINYLRRKQDALCKVDLEFDRLEEKTKICSCERNDFECDKGFWTKEGDDVCKLYIEKKDCLKGSTYPGSSGYRKIALSKCKEEPGSVWTKSVDRVCGDIDRSEGDIHMNAHIFDNQLKKYYYYRSTSTVVFLDHVGKVWKSHDNGETWIEETHDGAPLPAVVAIHADEYRPNRMFYITLSTEVFYSNDNGTKLYKFDAKLPPNGLREMILRTHYSKEDYLLWTGAKDCDSLFSACHTETFFSRSMGVNWDSVRTYTRGCTFGQTGDYRKPTEDAIYCINSEQTGDQRYSMIGNLEMSLDIGKTWSKQIEGVLGFAIVNEFLVAAQITTKDNQPDITLKISTDGSMYNGTVFPEGFKIPEKGYTVLESSTGRIFLDAFMFSSPQGTKDADYGALFRSRNGGFVFDLVLNDTNRNDNGNVDFEKIQGIPGIVLANVVLNPNEMKAGAKKRIGSKISFQDGDKFENIKAPERNLKGEEYNCDADKCSLHFHSFTDRSDKLDMFSQNAAVGIVIGVGNVGSDLAPYEKCNTFISRDAGKTFVEVAEHAHMFELGNRGSTVIMVNDEAPTDVVKYTLGPGSQFYDLKLKALNGDKIRVTHITTDDSGTKANFVIFGKLHTNGGEDKGKMAAVYVDFSNLWSNNCTADDFEAWDPPTVIPGQCAMGKRLKYYRQKPNTKCKITPDSQPQTVEISCDCVADDFECDTNFVKNGKECVLEEGKSPLMTECVDGKNWRSMGYVKKKKSGCTIKDYDPSYNANWSACGAAAEISALSWFFIVVLCIAVTAGVTWLFMNYKRFIHNGRIRLPLDSSDYAPASNASFTERAIAVGRNAMVYTVEFGEYAIQKLSAGVIYLRDQLTGRSSSGGGGVGDRQGYAPLYRSSVGERPGGGSPTSVSPGNDNSLLDDVEEDA